MRIYHFINREHGLDDIQRRRLKVALIDQLNDPFELLGVASRQRSIRDKYAVLKDGLAKYMGLLCFSANWQNPVQWSHYADRHRGLCLGFDTAADIHKVDYIDHRLKPDVRAMNAEGDRAEAHMLNILTTKFNHWQYEQECRLFVDLKDKDEVTGLHFFDFGKTLRLREVIVGHHSSVTREELAKAIGDLPSVRCMKARLAFQSFSVVRQRLDHLWE